MKESKRMEWLLECLIHVIGRAAIKTDYVAEVVGTGKKQIKAYNLSDGSLTQTDIAKKTGFDRGNLNRTIDRWVKSGVMFRFAEGKEVRLLHVFPIPEKIESRTK